MTAAEALRSAGGERHAQATLLRGARRGAAGVLAAPRRAPGADRLRAGAPRLRDVDGGEARARPRVDRRPVRPALPAHARRNRSARRETDAAAVRGTAGGAAVTRRSQTRRRSSAPLTADQSRARSATPERKA